MQREYTYVEDINHIEQNQFTNAKQEAAGGDADKQQEADKFYKD